MRRVEFLGGGERYKLELADHNEPPFEAVGLARNPIGLVGSQQERGANPAPAETEAVEKLDRLYLA